MSVTDSTALAVRPGHFDREQIDLLKATICKGATDNELALFVQTSQRLQLDPFARQVFAVKRKTWDNETRSYQEVMAIQVSIDGYRLVAERTGKYAGQLGPFWTGDGKEWVEVWLAKSPPAAAKVGVLRHDFKEPIWAVATWDQYKQEGRSGLTPMWVKMGPLMLAKCAESLALRRAFPNELSGVYTAEEMQQASPAESEYTPPEHPADVAARESFRAAAKDSPEPSATPPPPSQSSAPGVTSDPKARSASTPASSAGNGSPPSGASPQAARAGTRRTSGAADVKHDGSMLTKGQNDKIHALRAKSPTLSATPEHPNSSWKKKLAPYKRVDGKPCEHTNELSYGQASHLIDWLQAKADALDAKEREIRAGNDGAGEALRSVVIPPADLLEELHAQFPTAAEEDEWLAGLGFSSADDIPEESREMIILLLRSLKQGPSAYATNLTKARALGHVRLVQS